VMQRSRPVITTKSSARPHTAAPPARREFRGASCSGWLAAAKECLVSHQGQPTRNTASRKKKGAAAGMGALPPCREWKGFHTTAEAGVSPSLRRPWQCLS